MFPARFDYYRAGSVDEALDLLADHAGEHVELLAGGHSLLPMMKTGLAAPDALIDLGPVDELRGIEDNGENTSIGAMERYADLASDDVVREHCPALAEAIGSVGDIQVRNRGTIGGNVAHADPASDPPAAALASGATIHARGPDGDREIHADDFFLGLYETALDEGELLTRIEVPNIGDGVGAYAKKPSPSSGYAMIGVAAVIHADGDTIESARVAATGALDHAIRLEGVEEALVGAPAEADSAADAAEHAMEGVDEYMLMDDLQASGEYRAHLLEVYAGRAVEAAIDRL